MASNPFFAFPDGVRRFVEQYLLHFAVMITFGAGITGFYLVFFVDTESARELLDAYGLAAMFLILILEGAMLLYFAPSEALVPAGISLLTNGSGDYIGIGIVIGVAVIGATVGQFALFTVAKRAGREYLLQQSWFKVSERQIERFDGWFERWGPLAIPVSNALLFTRGMLTVPAGLADMDDVQFVVLSAIGTLIFQSWLAAVILFVDTRFGIL